MIKNRFRLAAIVLFVAGLGAVAPLAYAALDGPSDEPVDYIETHLLFGTARPDGGPAVTHKQFQTFVDEAITTRFPDGLTVDETYGQYRDRHGTIERERSYEVYLLYPRDDARTADVKIEKIRSTYNQRFQQESVARVDETARVDF